MLRKIYNMGMRSVSIRKLQINPSEELAELPFKIVRYKTVVARVMPPLDKWDEINVSKDTWEICKHGMKKGLCKKGCK